MQRRALDCAASSDSSSESDSCQVYAEPNCARYRSAELSRGLASRFDLARAVSELTGVLQVSDYSRLPHQLQKALLADTGAAIEACGRWG